MKKSREIIVGFLCLAVLLIAIFAPAVLDQVHDREYLKAWSAADAELSPLYQEWAINSQNKAYTLSRNEAIDISIKATQWQNQISQLPVSKRMQDTKNYRVLQLSEEAAAMDDWAQSAPKQLAGNQDKNSFALLGAIPDLQNSGNHLISMKRYAQMAESTTPK